MIAALLRASSHYAGGGALVCVALLCGCSGGATDALPREAISGSVTLDGKPLESGSIAFDPEANQAQPVSGGAVIIGGSYSIARDVGLTPGKYRVAIMEAEAGGPANSSEPPGAMPKPTATKSRIPEKYNGKTTLNAEVKAGANNKFDYALTSK